MTEPEKTPARPAPRGRVKVVLDLGELLESGRITEEEFERLLALSRKDTKKHAFAVAAVLALIAIVSGTVGLFPSFFDVLLRSLYDLLGATGLNLLFVVLAGAGACVSDSGFLAALCALAIVPLIGRAGLFYTHASYAVAITEPAQTAAVFALLGAAAYSQRGRLEPKRQRAAVIFSRTCLFLVNMSLWTASLWGADVGGAHVPDLVFVVVWALALAAAAGWGAARDKRWVVNVCAVFGSIHFYTQFFERLGYAPGVLLASGAIALGILYGLRAYNSRPRPGPAA
ncbi:MAG: hypothetical protein KGM24_14925 [Elusimicrobia bacterium]|nr:hypothetical protein [Elusimicrobiota bacterium]